jgi:hypothetical protein
MTVHSIKDEMPEEYTSVLAWEATLGIWTTGFYVPSDALYGAEWVLAPQVQWLTPVITHWCGLPPDPTKAPSTGSGSGQ